jgi:hypothetical protein
MLFNSVSFHFLLIAKRVLEIWIPFLVALFFLLRVRKFQTVARFWKCFNHKFNDFFKNRIAKTQKNTSIFLIEIEFLFLGKHSHISVYEFSRQPKIYKDVFFFSYHFLLIAKKVREKWTHFLTRFWQPFFYLRCKIFTLLQF